MSDGDWYCRNCGYLSAGRVTYAETCDECHVPVEWHDAEQATALEEAQNQIASLQSDKERLRLRVDELQEECLNYEGELQRYRWIPVSEPPEKDDDYLIFFNGAVISAKYWKDTGKWLCGDVRAVHGARPSHWRPIPESPND